MAKPAGDALAVFGQDVAQEYLIAPSGRRLRISEDLVEPGGSRRIAAGQVDIPAAQFARLQREMKMRLPVAHLAQDAQAVDRRRDQVGVAAQEGRVVLGEMAWRAAVDLQNAEHGLTLAADDGNVGDRPDAVSDQERRVFEPGFRCDIRGNHRLAGSDGMTLRTVVRSHKRCLAHDAGLPADACAHHQGLAVLLQFDDLGEIGT